MEHLRCWENGGSDVLGPARVWPALADRRQTSVFLPTHGPWQPRSLQARFESRRPVALRPRLSVSLPFSVTSRSCGKGRHSRLGIITHCAVSCNGQEAPALAAPQPRQWNLSWRASHCQFERPSGAGSARSDPQPAPCIEKPGAMRPERPVSSWASGSWRVSTLRPIGVR
jgi:hypothetical protein